MNFKEFLKKRFYKMQFYLSLATLKNNIITNKQQLSNNKRRENSAP